MVMSTRMSLVKLFGSYPYIGHSIDDRRGRKIYSHTSILAWLLAYDLCCRQHLWLVELGHRLVL